MYIVSCVESLSVNAILTEQQSTFKRQPKTKKTSGCGGSSLTGDTSNGIVKEGTVLFECKHGNVCISGTHDDTYHGAACYNGECFEDGKT